MSSLNFNISIKFNDWLHSGSAGSGVAPVGEEGFFFLFLAGLTKEHSIIHSALLNFIETGGKEPMQAKELDTR